MPITIGGLQEIVKTLQGDLKELVRDNSSLHSDCDALEKSCNHFKEQFNQMSEQNEQLLQRLEMDGWISVEDRLPEFEKDVICLVGGKCIEGFYNEEFGRFILLPWMKRKATHWMPLPKPPK